MFNKDNIASDIRFLHRGSPIFGSLDNAKKYISLFVESICYMKNKVIEHIRCSHVLTDVNLTNKNKVNDYSRQVKCQLIKYIVV